MKLVYTLDPIPNEINKSIFLAGPSLRSDQQHLISWRLKALDVLKAFNYDGVVFIPEHKNGKYDDLDYNQVNDWETKCLNIADNILFCINRNIEEGILGMTTNDEFGYWKKSGKCILCTLPNADNVRYQEKWADRLNIPLFHDLFNTIKYINKLQGDGNIRKDGERWVPLYIWNTNQFQSWYKDLKLAGNILEEAKVEDVSLTKNGLVFAFKLWANVFIKNENRHKNNEFIISRTDISACVMYYFVPDINEVEIVLVKEFRTPVSNKDGYVYELPGGSSIKPDIDPKMTVIEEIKEETGFNPKLDKLKHEAINQLQSTMLTHKCHLYSYQLDAYELNSIKMNRGKTFGNIEDTEITYLEVFKLKDILTTNIIDWSNIGMILSVINKKDLHI